MFFHSDKMMQVTRIFLRAWEKCSSRSEQNSSFGNCTTKGDYLVNKWSLGLTQALILHVLELWPQNFPQFHHVSSVYQNVNKSQLKKSGLETQWQHYISWFTSPRGEILNDQLAGKNVVIVPTKLTMIWLRELQIFLHISKITYCYYYVSDRKSRSFSLPAVSTRTSAALVNESNLLIFFPPCFIPSFDFHHVKRIMGLIVLLLFPVFPQITLLHFMYCFLSHVAKLSQLFLIL